MMMRAKIISVDPALVKLKLTMLKPEDDPELLAECAGC